MKKNCRLLGVLLVLVMIVTSMAACKSNENEGDKNKGGYEVVTNEESKYPKASELDPYSVGVLLWGYTDQLGASVKKNLEYLGKEFNVQFTFVDAIAMEEYISGTENLIQKGVDGILSLIVLPSMIEKCEAAGVYLQSILNESTDPDTLKLIAKSKYVTGMITENDYECGVAMVDDLYERGCRNIVWIAPEAGMAANHDNRVRGIEDAIKKYNDLNILANYRGSEQAEALQSFAATYPEMDGIIVTGGANGGTESIYQVMQSEGLNGQAILATIDIGEGTGDKLASGELGWIAGGQFPTTGIGFAILYNAMVGTPINDTPEKTIYRPFMVLQSKEDYDNYMKYVEGDIPPYTGEEVKALIKKFNPDASLELLQEYGDKYSIDDVVSRHKDLFN
ncbi:sugar ABC transporter substrate-binding protein [Herbinix luporum]|uniref:sugar ABC transporter substrate-binding protein n=1 Tax=Herbinix luporum TaxID=1679721 RepID=UPI0023F3C337|nr:substrate-binding domain-containing protein [Herbinix luporum]